MNQGPIPDIFKQTAEGRRLILCEPGTGKTNFWLELANRLITGAKREEVLWRVPRVVRQL